MFDADYYASKYSDLKVAFGDNAEALMKQFMTSGAKEGRVMSPIFDVVAYRAAYGDLDAAFGDDWDAYVDHYLTYGIKEGRKEGVLFDLVDYANKNSDVKSTYGEDYAAIAQHYLNHGMKEGRPGGVITKPAPVTQKASASTTSTTTNTTTTTPTEPETPAEPAKPTHTHAWAKVPGKCVAATCDQPGYDYYECQSTVMVNGVAVQCTATSVVPTTAKHTVPANTAYVLCATCTETGLISYTCTVCGQHVDETVPALGHLYDKANDLPVQSKISTCKEAGYDVYKCKRCGVNITVSRSLAPHSVAQWNPVKAATCTSEGERQGWCSVCGKNITEKTGMTAHAVTKTAVVIGNGKTNTAVTQHQKQTVTYCETCGYIATATDPVLENCVDGNGNGKCDVCGLDMNRPISNSAKIYNVGDYFFSEAH